jgi:hypothetical protein
MTQCGVGIQGFFSLVVGAPSRSPCQAAGGKKPDGSALSLAAADEMRLDCSSAFRCDIP